MSTDEQTGKEYLESLNRVIEGMDPTEKTCATAMVLVGQVLALLLNRRDWAAIEEVRKVCLELFAEVDRLKQTTSGMMN